jgi:ribosomal-protein-serine acetyltransferase
VYKVDLGGGAELRPLEPWQASEFLEHMERARATVDPWIPWASVSTDLDSARQTLQRYADKQARDEGRIYGIWLDGVLVGGTMFVSFDVASGNCEVGCWLEPAGTGHGLVTRAMRVLLDFAIERRGMHRVEWIAAVDNLPSLNVARRLGMSREGVRRSSYPHHGVRLDLEVWSILAPEWRAARARDTHSDH